MFRTRVGVISGSPAYIAPETVSGDTVDSRTDIYSLGVVLFEMLTGALPYDAHTPYDFLREHLVGMPMTLYQGCREVRWSSSLEALVAEMLAKEPADRPASCEEISARLEGGLKLEALDVASKGGDGSVNVSRSRFLNGFFKLLGR